MRRPTFRGARTHRRGAIAVLAALMLVFMLAMIAFAVDIGYIALVRVQLQAAADSAALAGAAAMNQSADAVPTTAATFAGYHSAGGRPVQLNASDVQIGTWDTDTKKFVKSTGLGNAVQVTVSMNDASGGKANLFFGRLFGKDSVADSASSVATMNPRDICFVIDLSGSMNDDTNPDGAAALNEKYADAGYPTIGTDIIQRIFDDFSFGTYDINDPGKCAGYPLLTTSSSDWLSSLKTMLADVSFQGTVYYTGPGCLNQTKAAYSYVIDYTIKQYAMPNAVPTPNSQNSTSYNYWKYYIDYRYYSGGEYVYMHPRLGYASYVRFMMNLASDTKVGSSNIYSPLSLKNTTSCPKHTWTTAGGPLSFPPREMPTHAGRMAVIAALQLIKTRNDSITDPQKRDWVSVIAFDDHTASTNSTVIRNAVRYSLDSGYKAAMEACTTVQACNANTATQTGLILAYNHIKHGNGGLGRQGTNKVIVLLTDGMPNVLDDSTNSYTIGSYIGLHPSTNFYNNSSYYCQDAALMQTSTAQREHWFVYPVGIGLGCDYDFMDRMGRMGDTADSKGKSPRGSGNPAEYEAVLTTIFQNIISHPKLRLVYTTDMHF